MKSNNQQQIKDINKKEEQNQLESTYNLNQKEIKQMRFAFNNETMHAQQLQQLVKQLQDQNKLYLKLHKDGELVKKTILFRYAKQCKATLLKINYPIDMDKQLIQKYEKPQQFTQIIFKGISHILFQNLKELYLAYNQITNIQPITYLINSPNLELLSLNQNYISRVRSMQKTKLNHLYALNLQKNPITQISSMTKMKISSEHFFDFLIDGCQLLDAVIVMISFKIQIKCLNKFQSSQQKEQVLQNISQDDQNLHFKVAKMTIQRFYE